MNSIFSLVITKAKPAKAGLGVMRLLMSLIIRLLKGKYMSKVINKAPMSAINLVLCLSGEHLVDPALIVDTIKSNAGLWAKVREYGKGNTSYESVSESLANYL